MNHEAKFQQIWEFRRKDHDGDSTDDSEANTSLEPSDKKHKSDIVLLDNDEVTDNPTPQKPDTSNVVGTVDKEKPPELVKKKRKPNKKKNVVKDKLKRRCTVKEQKKRKKPIKHDGTKEARMFNDLKNYADSLINELKVARENMLAQMKEEITKIVASRSRKKKRVIRTNQKNMRLPQNGKSPKCPGGMTEERTKSDKVTKQDQVLEFKMTNKRPYESERRKVLMKSHMHIAKNGINPESSHCLTLPIVLTKPHSQNTQSHQEIIHLDGLAPDKIDPPLMKQHSPSYYYYQGVPVTQSGKIRGFSHMSSKPPGFPDQNFSRMTGESIGFKVPINQELGSGLDDSNLSSQTYSDNVVHDNSGLRMSIGRFKDDGNGSSSRGIQYYSISSDVQKNVAFWPHEMKEQLYPDFRNRQ